MVNPYNGRFVSGCCEPTPPLPFPTIFEPFFLYKSLVSLVGEVKRPPCPPHSLDGWTAGLYNLSFCSVINVDAVGQVEEKWGFYWVVRNTKSRALNEKTQTSFYVLFSNYRFPFVCPIVHDVCVFLLIFKWTFSAFALFLSVVNKQDGDGEDGWDLLSVWIVPFFCTRPSLFVRRRGSLF